MSSDGLFQLMYKNLSDQICLNNLQDVCSKEFALLDNNLERVSYIITHNLLYKLLHVPPNRTNKDSKHCAMLKDGGNKHFQKKNHAAALSAYNKALLYAPVSDNDNLLSICYANRSAVLFHQAQYEACMDDIDRSIRCGYPLEMRYKLLVRKSKCHQYVRQHLKEECVTEALEALDISNLDDTAKKKCKADLLKVQDCHASSKDAGGCECLQFETNNETHPALSAAVKVAENNEFGRFIQACRDLSAGECVLLERPYCSVTLPEFYLTHCCHCQKRVDTTPIPCQNCTDVIYCSEDCQVASWTSYHKYECHQMSNLKRLNVNMGHLALRTAIQAGIDKLMYILDNGCDNNAGDYRHIFDLEGHENGRSAKDMFWRAVAAVILANMCDINQWGCSHSDDPVKHGSRDQGLTILASFILHHMQVLPCNAHEISDMCYDSKVPYKSELLEIGAGIYPTLSFFNHSCDPTVVRTFHQGSLCAVKTLSPIAQYEQVFDNYGCLYAVHSYEERQRKLSNQYYFQCCCEACMQHWPAYTELNYDSDPMYKCQNCGILIIDNCCDKCGLKFNKEATEKVLAQAASVFRKQLSILFTEQLVDGKLKDMELKFVSYSNLVNRLVFRPFKSLNDCQEALKHVFSLMGNHFTRTCID